MGSRIKGSLEKVEKAAMKFHTDERAGRLGRILERSRETEIDRLWIEEAERRHRELQHGSETVSADEALIRARAAIR